MSEMVEKAARAAREAVRNTPEGRSTPFEEMSRIVARAVIEAMREPTLEMLEAGDSSYRTARTSGISGMTIEAQIRSKCVRFGEGWRAAIDAVLSEEAR